ncbi:hypothetical protein IWQ51_003033 [Labrenzia sp. EL_142]|nr:hypothetical protein [Labrenzia sp. EL_142]
MTGRVLQGIAMSEGVGLIHDAAPVRVVIETVTVKAERFLTYFP